MRLILRAGLATPDLMPRINVFHLRWSQYFKTLQITRNAGTEVHDGSTSPRPFERGAMGAQVPLHNSIIGNFRDAGER